LVAEGRAPFSFIRNLNYRSHLFMTDSHLLWNRRAIFS